MKHSREEREQRKKLHEAINTPAPAIVEVGEDTIRKFLKKQSYSAIDLRKCAERLLDEYNYDHRKHFCLMSSVEVLDEVFENFGSKLKQPLFVICSKREDCWILLCLIFDSNKKTKVLCKDPLDNTVDQSLERKIFTFFEDVEFLVHKQEFDVKDEALSGPICLRNLKILLESFQKEPNNIVDNFQHLQFCTPSDMDRDRFGRVMTLTNEITKNREFLVTLRKYISQLSLRSHEDATWFLNGIDEATGQLLDEEVNEYEFEIQNTFPIEMETTQVLLQIIKDAPDNKEMLTTLKNVCSVLGLDYNKIKLFFFDSTNHDQSTQSEKQTLTIPDSSGHSSVSQQTLETNCGSLEMLVHQVMEELDNKDLPSLQSKTNIKNLDEERHMAKGMEGMMIELNQKDELCIQQHAKGLRAEIVNVGGKESLVQPQELFDDELKH